MMYTKLARYYDAIYREYLEKFVPKLVDAYERIFREYAERGVRDVLDVACGTGGPSLELAKRGYNVVGIDLHREVVEIAREKAVRMGIRALFRVADVRELDSVFPPESFDAVTMFFTSLNYMLNLDDLRKAMRAVYSVLRRGGVFVADTLNPYEALYRFGLRGGANAPTAWSVEYPETREKIVLLDWKEILDWVEGLVKFMRLVTIVDENGNTRPYLVSDTLRYYTATELMLVAQSVGFNGVDVLCYQGGGVIKRATQCSRLVLVAVKTLASSR